MIKIITHILLGLFIVTFLSFSTPLADGSKLYSTNGISVIVNNTNTTSDLTKKQLKSILKGEILRWPNKVKIIVATMKSNTPVGKLTAQKILNMSPNDMDQFYLMQVFNGMMTAPKTFETAEELKNFVTLTPGAIGIVEQGEISGTIKQLKIDGQEALTF